MRDRRILSCSVRWEAARHAEEGETGGRVSTPRSNTVGVAPEGETLEEAVVRVEWVPWQHSRGEHPEWNSFDRTHTRRRQHTEERL